MISTPQVDQFIQVATNHTMKLHLLNIAVTVVTVKAKVTSSATMFFAVAWRYIFESEYHSLALSLHGTALISYDEALDLS